ncbi:sce7726 family protein [Rheinheimera nanhaiensis]|uniref:sce7726 family protein n=1 Tax=Rheinheimera nanhaiensis TaxID=1163621 RepID=UPI0009DB44AF|nr:sce7726 family protein [Rheinheimera nanhaiensis]
MELPTSDVEIRQALHRKVLRKYHKSSSTLVIDELGLSHGKNRIDIAVLNGCLHGFEIKSSKDTLARLPTQLNEYERSLQKLTIVTASNHLPGVEEIAPAWCGIIEASRGSRGAINFRVIRKPTINPNVETMSIAHLLWKKEAIEILIERGLNDNHLKKNKKTLYGEIVKLIPIKQLVETVKIKFSQRESWRVDSQPL